MYRRTGVLAAATTICLIGALAAPAAAAPTTTDPASSDPGRLVARDPATATVTLVTGDRVTVSPDGTVGVLATDRRPGISYQISRNDGHVTVLPSDARALVGSGILDSRLFDVTTLIAAGYDDRHRDLGLIVEGGVNATGADRARSATGQAGAVTTRQLPSLGAVAARLPRAKAKGFWSTMTRPAANGRSMRSGVSRVWLDGIRKPLLDVSVPQIGAPSAWNAGLTGAGVTVAVLDTGIDASHPDLAGRVADHKNFTEGYEDDRDTVGHGTHVASTIAGNGAASDGKYRGVAPQAQLLDGKVCGMDGCAESWILAGMQWAAAEKRAKIISMSLGGPDSPQIDPLEQAVDTLTATYGSLFVIAAGNSGDDATVGSPGSADAALTVGAVDDTDALAGFSSRGPRVGDDAIKPDVTAPGVAITAALSKDSGGPAGESYVAHSGTSMATPHVSGAAALLLQQRPTATAAELKATLMGAAVPNPKLSPYAQGAGRIDVGRAIASTVTTDPASVSFGVQRWPHADDPVMTRTVTYRNTGAAAVTLGLALTVTGPDGAAAPTGMFTVSPSTLTVPAGGSAAATVTVDTTVASPDGYVGGQLTATGGAAPVTTPIAVNKEVESYDLKLTHLDRAGAATDDYFITLLRSAATGRVHEFFGKAEQMVRLPKGTYTLMALGFGTEADPHALFLVNPKVVVERDASLTIDGRVAKPVRVSVEGAADTPDLAEVDVVFTDPDRPAGFGVYTDSPMYTGHLGDAGATVDGLLATYLADWRPAGTAPDGRLESMYTTAWASQGTMFTELAKRVPAKQQATVVMDAAAAIPSSGIVRFSLPSWSFGSAMSAFGRIVPLPAKYRINYNTDAGIAWQAGTLEVTVDADNQLTGVYSRAEQAPVRYRAGRTVTEQWNRGVFGPSLGKLYGSMPTASRTGNVISTAIGLFGDGQGRAGLSVTATEQTQLLRDGTVIGSSPYAGEGMFTVPAGPGRYTLVATATRSTPFVASTSVRAAWTFASRDTGTATRNLPLWQTQFTPVLDETNLAPAGRRITVPVRVGAQSGAEVGRVRDLTVEVSYDDGATWSPAKVVRDGQRGGHIVVDNPAGGFVSLRSHLRDTDGNVLDQTIIRAYQVAAG